MNDFENNNMNNGYNSGIPSGYGYTPPANNIPEENNHAQNTPYAWRLQPPAQAQAPYTAPAIVYSEPKKEKRKGGKAVKGVAMLLACAIFGFGGASAALGVFGGFNGANSQPAQTPLALADNSDGDTTVSDIAAFAGQSVVMVNTEVNSARIFGGEVMQSAGSGVIIRQDGFIITNYHVIAGASDVEVTLQDGSKHQAWVVGGDEAKDIAVLKIDATGLPAAGIGNSDSLVVGEFCLAIGNPLGTLGGTVTDGIISGLNREISIGDSSMTLIQTNAAVSPGNSGGGLFSEQGLLVGIVNAKSAGNNAEGIGFAIPVNTAMQIAEGIISGSAPLGKPGLGVTVNMVTTQEAAEYNGYPAPGVYIAIINDGSAAEEAGLMEGDRIITADGQDINTNDDLTNIIAKKLVGDTLELTIERNGEQITVVVTLKTVNNI